MMDPSKFGELGYGDAEHWRKANTAKERVLLAAAQEQYEWSVDTENSIAMVQNKDVDAGESADLRRFAARLAVMSYDALWAAIKGRTRLDLVQKEDVRQALKPLLR